MPERAFLLSFDKIDATQRAQIQAAVANHASDWFHQQENVWIALGGPKSAIEWRQLLSPFVDGVPGNLLVFALPPMGTRDYSGFAPKNWFTWLTGVFLGKDDPAAPRKIDPT